MFQYRSQLLGSQWKLKMDENLPPSKRKCTAKREPLSEIPSRPIFQNRSEHEEYIRKMLAKPFKVPIPNYVETYSTKTLGIRRNPVRRALHDPLTPNALVNSRTDKRRIKV